MTPKTLIASGVLFGLFQLGARANAAPPAGKDLPDVCSYLIDTQQTYPGFSEEERVRVGYLDCHWGWRLAYFEEFENNASSTVYFGRNVPGDRTSLYMNVSVRKIKSIDLQSIRERKNTVTEAKSEIAKLIYLNPSIETGDPRLVALLEKYEIKRLTFPAWFPEKENAALNNKVVEAFIAPEEETKIQQRVHNEDEREAFEFQAAIKNRLAQGESLKGVDWARRSRWVNSKISEETQSWLDKQAQSMPAAPDAVVSAQSQAPSKASDPDLPGSRQLPSAHSKTAVPNLEGVQAPPQTPDRSSGGLVGMWTWVAGVGMVFLGLGGAALSRSRGYVTDKEGDLVSSVSEHYAEHEAEAPLRKLKADREKEADNLAKRNKEIDDYLKSKAGVDIAKLPPEMNTLERKQILRQLHEQWKNWDPDAHPNLEKYSISQRNLKPLFKHWLNDPDKVNLTDFPDPKAADAVRNAAVNTIP